jgi:hypothetical protein
LVFRILELLFVLLIGTPLSGLEHSYAFFFLFRFDLIFADTQRRRQ